MSSQLFPHRQVSVLVTSPARIQQLNRQFRGVDEATDVLSFPAASQNGTAGEIALCWPTAEQQARVNGNTALAEAAALVAHGLLHLAGHDHDDALAGQRMDDLTRQLCSSVGIEVTIFGH